MAPQDKDMLNDLVAESREHIAAIEPDLLSLERQDNVSDELVNRIFRAIHSIKGGFSFFGIKKVIELSHTMENVLSRVRDKELEISPALTDALLQGIDKLRELLDDVDNTDAVEIASDVARLLPFMSGSGGHAPAAASAAATGVLQAIVERHPAFSAQIFEKAVRNGRFIYEMHVTEASLEKGQTLQDRLDVFARISDIISVVPEDETAPEHHILIASVLESDLISIGSEISDASIARLPAEEMKAYFHLEAGRKVSEDDHGDSGDDSKRKSQRQGENKAEDSLRVRVDLLNNLMNRAGELVLSRNQLLQRLSLRFSDYSDADRVIKTIVDHVRTGFSSTGGLSAESDKLEAVVREALGFRLVDIQGVNSIVQNMDMVTSIIQENIMATRMQPVNVVFSKFPRVIRDLARKMGKEIELTIIGQDVELDKSIIEKLSDPLTHLVRNSADHGIEPPDAREKSGKSAKGQVVLRAFHEGGKVNIEISDDGRGIDPEKVKRKAIERQLITEKEAEKMGVRELQMLIMEPGFSTAEVVSDVSGRGVGMDVVKTNIEQLGGSLEVESEPGQGTRIVLRLPLTLAIIPSLIIACEGRRFAVPQVGLEEIVRIRAMDVTRKIESVQGSEVLRLRGKLLPLVRLADVLGLSPTFVHPETGEVLIDKRARWSDRRGPGGKTAEEIQEEKRRAQGPDRREAVANAVKIVVLRMEKNLFGLVVDDVLDSEEIVVKPLSYLLKNCMFYSGATIMGDGRVAMILDPNGIAQSVGLRFENIEKDIAEEKARAEREKARKLEDVLIFSNGGTEQFGLRLSSIARIEKRSMADVDIVGGKEFLKYDDRTLRLIRLHDYLPVNGPSNPGDRLFVIVPAGVAHPIGLVAQKVEDVIQREIILDKKNITGVGVDGSMMIDKKLTIMVDIKNLFAAAEPELYAA